MGLGAGLLLLAAGAILTYAVDVDLPYVDDDALGSMLIAAGVLSLVVTAVIHAVRAGQVNDAGTGLLLVAGGAILVWGLDVDVPYIWDGALGAILMVGGAVSIGAAVLMQRQRARSRRVVEYR
jgi:hypothetical protein